MYLGMNHHYCCVYSSFIGVLIAHIARECHGSQVICAFSELPNGLNISMKVDIYTNFAYALPHDPYF